MPKDSVNFGALLSNSASASSNLKSSSKCLAWILNDPMPMYWGLSSPSEPKTNLGTKGFTLAQRLRVQPIVVGKSWPRTWGVGHIAPTIRKPRVMSTCTQLPFSFLSSVQNSRYAMVPATVKMGLPTWVNLIYKTLHRFSQSATWFYIPFINKIAHYRPQPSPFSLLPLDHEVNNFATFCIPKMMYSLQVRQQSHRMMAWTSKTVGQNKTLLFIRRLSSVFL